MIDVLNNMHLFVEVASAGGFRAAGKRLGMPNSTLSRRIGELERDLRVRLFNRTTRRVELTEAGQLYFERCQRIVHEARLAQEELSGLITQPVGLIRASVPVDFTVVFLSEILADFLSNYPGISLDLDVSPRQSDLIADPVDIAIRIGEPKEQGLIARKIGTAKLALYAAPRYLEKHGHPQTPEDLAKLNCLRVADRPWKLIEIIRKEEAVVPVTGSFIANNVGVLRNLAVAGAGIVALTKEMTSDDVEAGRLVRVLPEWQPPQIPIFALTATRLIPVKVRVFVDFLTDALGRTEARPT